MSNDRKLLADPNAWYISDAERVELLRAEVERLRAEVEHGQQAYNDALAGGDILKDEVERLREALRDIKSGDYDSPMCWRIRQQARKALEGGR